MELSTRYRSQRVAPDLALVLCVALGLGIFLTAVLLPDPWARHVFWLSAAALIGGLLVPVRMSISVLRRTPKFLTPADRITLGRGVLIGGCAPLAVLAWGGVIPAQAWPFVLVAVPAMLLDGVDGWVARKTGTANDDGARLDMETDAAFLMILSIAAAPVVGGWVLVIGAMRYVFVAAGWWRPALRRKLQFSNFRRSVAGLQSIALVIALAPITSTSVAVFVVALALGLLLISFGKDIATLESSYRRETMASNSHNTSRGILQKVLTVFWVVLVVAVAAKFILESIKKLLGDSAALAPFIEFGWPIWFAYVIAVTEIVASVLLFVPKTRVIGALLLAGVMIGAAATNLVNGHPDYIWVNVFLFVAAALLALQRPIDKRLRKPTSRASMTGS